MLLSRLFLPPEFGYFKINKNISEKPFLKVFVFLIRGEKMELQKSKKDCYFMPVINHISGFETKVFHKPDPVTNGKRTRQTFLGIRDRPESTDHYRR
jgi:hypothetical protein